MWHIKSLTHGDVKTAFGVLRQNRGRSLVTIFGIVIALVSVILIVGIGKGVQYQVKGQVDSLGKDVIMVRPGGSHDGLSGSLGSLVEPSSVESLSHSDYETVQGTPGVAAAVPLSTVDGTVVTEDGNSNFSGPVVATTGDFLDVMHQQIDEGGFFSEDSSDARAVLGSDVAVKLFDTRVPLGRSFRLGGENFIVSGILKQFNSNPLLGDADFNNSIFIKYRAAQQLTGTKPTLYEILAKVDDNANVDQTASAIERNLGRNHRSSSDFAVLQQGQALQATNAILDLLTKFIFGAAAIALLLGGIGVMNIMLVSVTERMHEIGIRKAVGATNQQILSQFLTESVLLSLIGGLLGLALSAALIGLIDAFTNFHPMMPWSLAFTAVILAMIIGGLFGSFPALKAARKDPISALRGE